MERTLRLLLAILGPERSLRLSELAKHTPMPKLRLPGSFHIAVAAVVFLRKRLNKPDSALLHIFQTGSDWFISICELIREASTAFPFFSEMSGWFDQRGFPNRFDTLDFPSNVSGRGLEGRR